MFPIPLAVRLVAVLLFVHEKIVPATAPENRIGLVVPVLQITRSAGFSTVGIGFTVTSV